jgi:hypothetical protein
MPAKQKYTMTVDLSVLESLGINLYSNAAAVLSELVANAYDADATQVDIDWKNGSDEIVVVDDGTGMNVKELNERFLKVGYKKRANEGFKSPKFDRPFMGRKGIGKLSVFSIAKTVFVYSTTSDGQSNGLRIVVGDLEKAIRSRKEYHPKDVPVPPERAKQGTCIVLTDLKGTRADLTANALRKRLARRFDVLDQKPKTEGGFYINVNGSAITYADRQELKRLEFIWEFGRKTLPDAALPKDVTRFVLRKSSAGPGWTVRGWIGTARRPTDLTDDEEAGSLKNIIVLARKRPIQEGIIEKLDFSRIFGNYVTGQIEADFLDLDDREDIATSDRQRLMEDDERVVALQKFLREAFLEASEQWSEARPKKEAEDVLRKYPQLKTWVESRPGWQRDSARKMLGTIASLEMERKNEAQNRTTLFRSGILAFERLGLRQVADDLNNLATVKAEDLLPLLGAQDSYEAGLWVDILRSRVEAIDRFRDLSSANEKEKVLQKHLFDHLWLLDPSWERAAVGGRMEENLKKVAPGIFATGPDGKEIKGRIDIRYAKASGRHVIVELKRYNVNVDVTKLVEQGLKYVNALRSILQKQNKEDDDIEVVFVLGKRPGAKDQGLLEYREYVAGAFRPINGRYVLYDELIENAKQQYDEYLQATDLARELDKLLSTFEYKP